MPARRTRSSPRTSRLFVKLVDEYGTEILKDVQRDVADLKTQVATNTATLRRQQFHLYYFLSAPGTFQELGAVFQPNGLAAAPGVYTGPNTGAGSSQKIVAGVSSHGTAYQVLRMVFSGQVNEKVSYAIRLEDRYYLDGTPNQGGNSTSSSTPGVLGATYPNSSFLRVNYAYVKYTDPSGVNATVGRFVDTDGDIGLAWSDYFNGGRLGYNKGPLNVYAFYSFLQPSNSNTIISNSTFAPPAGPPRWERRRTTRTRRLARTSRIASRTATARATSVPATSMTSTTASTTTTARRARW